MKRKHPLINFSGAVCAIIASTPYSIASANEIAAELPDGAKVKREKPSWGKELRGLKLGISLDYLNRPYKIGEVAAFTFTVRNVSRKPIKLTYFQPDWSIAPNVVDAKNKQLSPMQQVQLYGPAYNMQVHSVTAIVKPKQTLEITHAYLTIGPPAKDERNPNLNVTPEKYKVSYNYAFHQDLREDKSETVKSWVGQLSSGRVILQVIPK